MTFLQVVKFWTFTLLLAVFIFGASMIVAFFIAKFTPQSIDDLPIVPYNITGIGGNACLL